MSASNHTSERRLMSTLVVPVEMLVSRSPPAFSHSPPAGFLTDYCSTTYESPRLLKTASATQRPRVIQAKKILPSKLLQSRTQSFVVPEKPEPTMPASPRRPCLVIRPTEDSNSSSNDEADPTSPTRLKKKVVFADDRGMALTQIRVMSEPSNVPPLWSLRFLSQVTRGLSSETVPEPWEVTFPQPASDYVEFRKRLDTKCVSLENVIIKDSEDTVVGTVKVRNIAFHKEVIVRTSNDNWLTHEDAFCTYVQNTTTIPNGAVYVLYDTFSFKVTLPPQTRRLEFCVCFRCEGVEYWDNNQDKNYILIKKAPIATNFTKSLSCDNILAKPNNPSFTASPMKKCRDISETNIQMWSEFASWTHLDTTTPYW